jgi:hypothetical protein
VKDSYVDSASVEVSVEPSVDSASVEALIAVHQLKCQLKHLHDQFNASTSVEVQWLAEHLFVVCQSEYKPEYLMGVLKPVSYLCTSNMHLLGGETIQLYYVREGNDW